MGVQNRGTLPALSHELAEFGQIVGGGATALATRLAYLSPAATSPINAGGLGSTNYADSWGPISTTRDLAVNAVVGDTIKVEGTLDWGNEGGYGRVTFATINGSGTRINTYNNVAYGGVKGWVGQASIYSDVTAFAYYTVTAADVISGKVTIRLFAGADGGASKTIQVLPLCSIQNLGQ